MAIRFLLNPSAGRGRARRALGRLHRLAAEAGGALAISEDAADLVGQARQAVTDGIERLVVAGGDGTFHHVSQGLQGESCALGLVPVGRGNDLAATLGVPTDLEAAVEFALHGPVRKIDLGIVNGRAFAGYCGLGFDSEAAQIAHKASHLFRGPIAYVYSFIRTLVTFKPPVMKVRFDGGDFEGRSMFVVACNIPRFGGGMRIAPEARCDDGWLDLVITEELSRRQLLRVFPKVYRGKHVDHPAVRMVRTRSARISADRVLAVASDGEPLFRLDGESLEVSVTPLALSVVARV